MGKLIPRILFFISCFFLFCSLGVWQLNRLSEKEAIITNFQQNFGHPIKYTKNFRLKDEDLYKKVTFKGRFISNPIYYYTSSGYEIIQPFKTEYNQYFLVNRGLITSKPENVTLKQNKEIKLTGVILNLPSKKPFGVSNDLRQNVWFYIDEEQLSKFYKLDKFVPAIIIPYEKVYFIGKPVTIESKIKFRNDHLGYALTWFSLAVVTVIMAAINCRKYINVGKS